MMNLFKALIFSTVLLAAAASFAAGENPGGEAKASAMLGQEAAPPQKAREKRPFALQKEAKEAEAGKPSGKEDKKQTAAVGEGEDEMELPEAPEPPKYLALPDKGMERDLTTSGIVPARERRHRPLPPRAKIFVNGQLQPPDFPAYFIVDRVYVPMEGFYDRLGVTVEWWPWVHADAINYDDPEIDWPRITGDTSTYNPQPIVINGMKMIPVRFVGEAIGADVIWKSKDWAVYIYF